MMLTTALMAGAMVCAVPHVVWLVWLLVAAIFKQPMPPYAPFGWTALGLAAAVWLAMAYGFVWGRFRVWVNQTEYANADIPAAFDGYKIVHISDLHLSTFDDRPVALQRVVDSINALRPDLICFTGDLVTMGVAEAAPYTDMLRQLHATDGVASVLGNHDMLIYNRLTEDERLRGVECLAAYEREKLGWRLLRNGNIRIERGGAAIHIVGVDNSSCAGQGFQTIYGGDLGKALDGTDGFRVLLSHDPTQWRAEIVGQTDIPLTLSGHTHAGQVRLFGHALSSLMFRESAGWYRQGGQSLYVNEGIGCTAPFRINCPSEITVITLKRQPAAAAHLN